MITPLDRVEGVLNGPDLCDPRFHAVPLKAPLGPAQIRRLAESGAVGGAAELGAGSDGWAVSIIQSVYHGFGAAILKPSTGIVAHDRGA